MVKVKVNSTEYTVGHGQRSVFVNDEEVRIDIYKVDTNTFHLLYNNKSIPLHIKEYCREDDRILFEIKGKLFECHLISSIEQTIINMSGEGSLSKAQKELKSPMPGLIQKVLCQENQHVKKGEQVVVLSAMKMENVIKASEDCVVTRILVKEGEQVEKGKVLIQF